jgi:hypothetical protein
MSGAFQVALIVRPLGKPEHCKLKNILIPHKNSLKKNKI